MIGAATVNTVAETSATGTSAGNPVAGKVSDAPEAHLNSDAGFLPPGFRRVADNSTVKPLTKASGYETRPRAPRFFVSDFHIVYDIDDSYWCARVMNLSESGFFIETAHELPVGTQLTILPHGSTDNELPMEFVGEVVRTFQVEQDSLQTDDTSGIAVKLLDLKLGDFDRIRKFLRNYGE